MTFRVVAITYGRRIHRARREIEKRGESRNKIMVMEPALEQKHKLKG